MTFSPRLWVASACIATLTAALPAAAQHHAGSGSRARGSHAGGSSVRPRGVPNRMSQSHVRVASRQRAHAPRFRRHRFIPGIGLVPAVRERFPVFGLGFDAHHFQVLHGRRRFTPTMFRGHASFGTGFFPLVAGRSVVVVPQVVEVPVPIFLTGSPVEPTTDNESTSGSALPPVAGLPPEWFEPLRVVEPSLRREPPPLAQLTLLVLKDGSIFAAANYWLEGTRLILLSSTGAQKTVDVAALDWPMTTRLNAERDIRVVLRSSPQ